MVVPAFTSLFARSLFKIKSITQFMGDNAPLFCSILFDKSTDVLIFLIRPWSTFDTFRHLYNENLITKIFNGSVFI